MKKLLLIISLGICFAGNAFANTQAENQIIELLRLIKDNGAGGGGGGGAVTQSGVWTMQPGNTANTTPWLAAINKITGAPNYANGQVTATTTAGTFVAARATRRSALLLNTDATITVYLGAATVTAGNGVPLKAGQSVSVDTTALIQVIAASGTPVVAYVETYD